VGRAGVWHDSRTFDGGRHEMDERGIWISFHSPFDFFISCVSFWLLLFACVGHSKSMFSPRDLGVLLPSACASVCPSRGGGREVERGHLPSLTSQKFL
jgi:hypothetical protein